MGEHRVKVKICGITNVKDAVSACELGANAIGLVFSDSPRKVALATARAIVERVAPFVTIIGVFVNEDPEFVSNALASCPLDLVQLHGDESPEYCSNFPGRVIKSFRINKASDLSPLNSFSVRAMLLDSRIEGSFGGTGRTFDWTIIGDASQLRLPVILAGGLSADNVTRAIGTVNPYAVDVSSSVELAPGIKDYGRMREFIQRVRDCEKVSG